MEFLVLGPLQVGVAGRLTRIGAPKQRALLGVLLVHVDQVVSTDRLLEEVWGDHQPAGGVKTLRYHISKLRDALEPNRSRGEEGVVVFEAGAYALRVKEDQVDAGRFETLAGEGAQLLADGDARIARKYLGEALGLWRGAAFEDFRYDGFAQGEIARLEELRILCLEDRIAADLELGRHHDVLGELRELTTKYPLRERLWGQLMVALYRSDQQGEALRAYQTARTVLGEELGIEPNTALQRLEEQILFHELPFEPPEMVKPPSDNLPVRTSSFIGRSDDIAEVEQLIAERRLVTLTGFAGIGKTSLAIEVARRLATGFPDGVWLTELAPLTDPSYVVSGLAAVLDVRAHPTRPLLDRLVEELASKSMLLIVDNCEHLLAETARVVEALLAGCPMVRVLATSREPLRLPGEQIWPVPPLDLPTAGEVSVSAAGEIEAVQLFVDRARQSQPGFELDESNVGTVVTICRRLEGIPLAIELAAARLRMLSPHDLLNRLDDQFAVLTGNRAGRPERHRTLKAAIEWSYELLGVPERTLLRRLAVFEGGFTLDAVENVCGGDTIDPNEVLDLVGHLLDASLLTVGIEEPRRYGMLESVLQYASELLAGSGEETTLRDRHADYYDWTGPVDPDFDSAEFGELLGLIAVDYDNFRSALAWSIQAEDGDRALRLMGRIRWHSVHQAQAAEFLHWAPKALDLTAGAPPTVERARILRSLTESLSLSGRRQEAAAVLDELQDVARQLDDVTVTASAKSAESFLLYESSDIRSAQKAEKECADILRTVQDPGLSVTLYNMAEDAVDLGDFDSAIEVIDELEDLTATLDQTAAQTFPKTLRGMLALYRGDLQTARKLLVEALGELRRLRRVGWTEGPLRYLTELSAAAADTQVEESWAQQLVDLSRRRRIARDTAKGHTILAQTALRQERLQGAVEAASEALTIAVDADDTWVLAWVLATIGQIAWAGGDAPSAALLHAAAETLRSQIGFVHPNSRARELEHEYTEIRTALGANAFNTAWKTGTSLSKKALIGQARRVLSV